MNKIGTQYRTRRNGASRITILEIVLGVTCVGIVGAIAVTDTTPQPDDDTTQAELLAEGDIYLSAGDGGERPSALNNAKHSAKTVVEPEREQAERLASLHNPNAKTDHVPSGHTLDAQDPASATAYILASDMPQRHKQMLLR